MKKGGFARKLEQMLAGAFALPGCSSQLRPNFPCAVFVFVFSPLPGLLWDIYLQERKGSWVWWHPSPSGSSPFWAMHR